MYHFLDVFPWKFAKRLQYYHVPKTVSLLFLLRRIIWPRLVAFYLRTCALLTIPTIVKKPLTACVILRLLPHWLWECQVRNSIVCLIERWKAMFSWRAMKIFKLHLPMPGSSPGPLMPATNTGLIYMKPSGLVRRRYKC